MKFSIIFFVIVAFLFNQFQLYAPFWGRPEPVGLPGEGTTGTPYKYFSDFSKAYDIARTKPNPSTIQKLNEQYLQRFDELKPKLGNKSVAEELRLKQRALRSDPKNEQLKNEVAELQDLINAKKFLDKSSTQKLLGTGVLGKYEEFVKGEAGITPKTSQEAVALIDRLENLLDTKYATFENAPTWREKLKEIVETTDAYDLKSAVEQLPQELQEGTGALLVKIVNELNRNETQKLLKKAGFESQEETVILAKKNVDVNFVDPIAAYKYQFKAAKAYYRSPKSVTFEQTTPAEIPFWAPAPYQWRAWTQGNKEDFKNRYKEKRLAALQQFADDIDVIKRSPQSMNIDLSSDRVLFGELINKKVAERASAKMSQDEQRVHDLTKEIDAFDQLIKAIDLFGYEPK